jgi:hypothetical protein
MIRANRFIGWAAIAMAIAFNIPYAILAATYDYPDILRRTPAQALDLFAAGGASLIITWYAFALIALLLAPLSVALAVSGNRLRDNPVLAVLAAATGSLAGITQAIGLLRWVFVVPGLAADHSDPAATFAQKQAAEHAFMILNSYGGVAIGEHMGQLLTAMFVAAMASMQYGNGSTRAAMTGFGTAAAITIGTGEGIAMAVGRDGALFSAFTIGGFLGLTLWLIATGASAIGARFGKAGDLLRTPKPV